jgi:pimeloyl-ACP methyl ester carboxylesterase
MDMASDWHVPQVRHVETADGRGLRVEVAGDCRRVVVVQVGSPCAGVLDDRWVQDASVRGLTLISYDRPGYGGSSPQPGRSVADCAADVRTISEAMGFERCVVWGFSGGGPHAMACGALLDDLVTAVATIGSPAPFDGSGFDYFAGMPDAAVDDIALYLSDPAEWERRGQAQRDAVVALNADDLAQQWSAGAAPADAVVLRGDFGGWLHRSVHAALAPGVAGWIGDDIAVFHTPWGFEPGSISLPVKVWHSLDDRFVPFLHGRWLADTIPGAQAALRDDDGHLTVVAQRIGEVHEWLAQYI